MERRDIPLQEHLYTDRESEVQLIDAVRDHVVHVMRAQGTPGLNLAIGYSGRLIWEAGFGHADVAAQKPMSPQTVFHSGSLGKTYTATAVMQLIEEGILQLDDSINRHLPFTVRNPLGERDITVRDLLTHRSGLSGDSAESRFTAPGPLADEIRTQYASDPNARRYGDRWNSKVGQQFAYSNLGIATLGLIVERVNPERLAFHEYVQKHVIDPLGMTSTQYPPVQDEAHVRPDIWEQVSTGYSRMGAMWIPALPVYFGNYPAGGVLGKPSDHLRLLLAMANGGHYCGYQLLQPQTVELMLTPINDEIIAGVARQALVWRVANRKFFHSGGHMYGWTTQGVAWPAYGLALMAAANQWSLPDKSSDVFMIEDFVESWLLRQSPDVTAGATSLEWSRKVSYVRGVLFAFSYKTHCGIPDAIPEQSLSHSIDAARLQPGARDDWDAEYFRRGVEDFGRIGFAYGAADAFWQKTSVVTAAEVQTIYRELGGLLDPASYSIAFLPERARG